MADIETLKALLERVQAAGPEHSPVLDAHIICALIAPAEAFVSLGPISGVPRICIGKMSDGRDRVWEPWLEWRLTHPTASIDAAVLILGRVLPRWDLEFDISGVGGLKKGWATLRGPDLSDSDMGQFVQTDGLPLPPPLAICAALLSAIIAQAEQGATPTTEDKGRGDRA